MGFNIAMYRTAFRILETDDEFFYSHLFGYWYLNGFNLPDPVLRKVYRANARAF
jgi:uncharacterized protein